MKLLALGVLSLGLAASSLAPTPASTQTDEQTIAQFERNLAQAVITKDTTAIEAMWPADFYAFNLTTGTRSTRAEYRAGIKLKSYTVTAMHFPRFLVRVFGSTAIAQGTNDGSLYAVVQGKKKLIPFRNAWFDVFEKRNGRWVWLVSTSPFVGQKVTDKVVCTKPFCALNEPAFAVGS